MEMDFNESGENTLIPVAVNSTSLSSFSFGAPAGAATVLNLNDPASNGKNASTTFTFDVDAPSSSAYDNAVSAVRESVPMIINGNNSDQFAHTIAQMFKNGNDLAKFAAGLAAISRVHRPGGYAFVEVADRIKLKQTIQHTSLNADTTRILATLPLYSIVEVAKRAIVTTSGHLTFTLDGIENPITGTTGSFPTWNRDSFTKEVLLDFKSNVKYVMSVGAVPNPYYKFYPRFLSFVGDCLQTSNWDNFNNSVAAHKDDMLKLLVLTYQEVIKVLSQAPAMKFTLLVAEFAATTDTLQACRSARGEDNYQSMIMPYYYLNAPKGLNLVLMYRVFAVKYNLKIQNPHVADLAPPSGNDSTPVEDLCARIAKGTGASTIISTFLQAGIIVRNNDEYVAGQGNGFLVYPLCKESVDNFQQFAMLVHKGLLHWAPSYTPHNSTIIVTTIVTGYTLVQLFEYLRFVRVMNIVRTIAALCPFNAGGNTALVAANLWEAYSVPMYHAAIGAVKTKFTTFDGEVDFDLKSDGEPPAKMKKKE